MTEAKRIGHTQPLKIHKRLLIYALTAHPEDLHSVFPEPCPFKTADEAIKALQEHPGTWIVDGVLSEDNGTE